MTSWLDPKEVEAWLGSPYDLHPLTPDCPGCKIDCEWGLHNQAEFLEVDGDNYAARFTAKFYTGRGLK